MKMAVNVQIAILAFLFMMASAARAEIYYYHNDHLGTPQIMTNSAQQVVWETVRKPFGETTVVVNTIENNLGFPGQYFDAETGLYQNYFRDYDATTGRYTANDPLGLSGGLNSYGYVYSNPLLITDRFGLLSTFEAYAHYFFGDGSTLTASFSEVDTGIELKGFSKYPPARSGYISSGGGPIVAFQDARTVDVGGAVFGNIDFELKGEFSSNDCTWKFEGKIGVRDNRFDFDKKDPGEREVWKERVTRIIGGIPGGTPYDITFDGSRSVSDKGNL